MRFSGNSRYVTSLLAGLVFALVVVVLLLIVPSKLAVWNTNPTLSDPRATSTAYLETQEVVFVQVATTSHHLSTSTQMLKIDKVLLEYVEVSDSCGPHFSGECLNAREGPGTDFPIQRQLRNGVVLKVGGSVMRDGQLWYQVVF